MDDMNEGLGFLPDNEDDRNRGGFVPKPRRRDRNDEVDQPRDALSQRDRKKQGRLKKIGWEDLPAVVALPAQHTPKPNVKEASIPASGASEPPLEEAATALVEPDNSNPNPPPADQESSNQTFDFNLGKAYFDSLNPKEQKWFMANITRAIKENEGITIALDPNTGKPDAARLAAFALTAQQKGYRLTRLLQASEQAANGVIFLAPLNERKQEPPVSTVVRDTLEMANKLKKFVSPQQFNAIIPQQDFDTLGLLSLQLAAGRKPQEISKELATLNHIRANVGNALIHFAPPKDGTALQAYATANNEAASPQQRQTDPVIERPVPQPDLDKTQQPSLLADRMQEWAKTNTYPGPSPTSPAEEVARENIVTNSVEAFRAFVDRFIHGSQTPQPVVSARQASEGSASPKPQLAEQSQPDSEAAQERDENLWQQLFLATPRYDVSRLSPETRKFYKELERGHLENHSFTEQERIQIAQKLGHFIWRRLSGWSRPPGTLTLDELRQLNRVDRELIANGRYDFQLEDLDFATAILSRGANSQQTA